jgi:hypothetical protein
MPLSKKCKLADFVVTNDGTLEELRRDVSEAYTWMLRQSSMKLTMMISATAGCALGLVAAVIYIAVKFI